MTRPLPTPLQLLTAALLLALHLWAALSATADKSATFDEPLHLVGGYAYETAGDFRLHPENGVLPQRWAGRALRDLAPALPLEGYEFNWQRSDLAILSTAFLHDVNDDHRAILAAGRRAAILWSAALAVLVCAWAWTLWGANGALFALALFALSPTTLAHAPLVTSDMCAALFLVAATWAWWQHLQRPSVGSLLLSAVATGLASIAKFSAAILPPLFVLLGLWMLWRVPTWTLQWRGPRTIRGLVPRLGWLAIAALVHLLVTALIIWAAFDFRFSPVGARMPAMTQYYHSWEAALPLDGFARTLVLALRDWRLLPEAYVYGFGMVLRFAEGRAGFLNGEFGERGWAWFFPYAFFVKSAIAELLAAATALGLGVAAWRRQRARDAAEREAMPRGLIPLLAFAVVYVAISLTSNLNIGHRHLLPLYPVLFIGAGGIVAVGAARWRQLLAVAILALAAIESASVRPHYLAFFNASVGGPSQGWRHLVDSSLDWGQDVPALAAWLQRERRDGEPLYYNVFGQRRLEDFGIEGVQLAPGFTERARPWVEWGPGLYAISATMLQDVYSPLAGPWDAQRERNFQYLSRTSRAQRAQDPSTGVIPIDAVVGDNYYTLERLQFARLVNYLRLRSPEAQLGYTIFVHRLSAAEAEVITAGDTPAYLALLDAAR